MRLSIIVPTLDGSIPASLQGTFSRKERKEAVFVNGVEVELIVVEGVSPVGKARNLGLKRATGDYIAWIDSDDEISPDYLIEITSILQLPLPTTTNPPSLLILDYILDFGSSSRPKLWTESGRGPLADLLSGRLSPECWRFVSHRSLWEGLSFDESSEVAEDYRIMPRVLRRARSFKHLGLLYRYHVNSASLMHDFSEARAIACLKAAEDRLEEFRGSAWEADARADTIRWAGWLFESGQIRPLARRFLSSHLLEAWRCPALNLWWKVKVPLLLLGFEPLFRRLYRFPSLRFWK